MVAAVWNEEIESWGVESDVEAFEILGPQLALWVVHSAAQDGTQVLVTINQHGT
jgi:hypothetical protein